MANASCALRSSDEPPGPGWERGGIPNLDGVTVLVLPVQRAYVTGGDIDSEIVFALRARAGERLELRDVSDLCGMTEGAGAFAVNPAHLDVSAFFRGEVERVGDPLYGAQYRLAALVGADLVLLPVQARSVVHGEEEVSVVLNAALLEPRSGRVVWQGILEGDRASAGSPGSAASVAEHLAARLLP